MIYSSFLNKSSFPDRRMIIYLKQYWVHHPSQSMVHFLYNSYYFCCMANRGWFVLPHSPLLTLYNFHPFSLLGAWEGAKQNSGSYSLYKSIVCLLFVWISDSAPLIGRTREAKGPISCNLNNCVFCFDKLSITLQPSFFQFFLHLNS